MVRFETFYSRDISVTNEQLRVITLTSRFETTSKKMLVLMLQEHLRLLISHHPFFPFPLRFRINTILDIFK